MADHAHTTSRPKLAINRLNLDDHPDGLLMRLCAHLGRLRAQLEALERAIECIPAVTVEGRRMKECSL